MSNSIALPGFTNNYLSSSRLTAQSQVAIEQLLAQSVSADVRQRATSAVMRLCARLAHKTEISSLLFATVDTLFVASTDEDLLGCVRSQLATGVCSIVQATSQAPHPLYKLLSHMYS